MGEGHSMRIPLTPSQRPEIQAKGHPRIEALISQPSIPIRYMFCILVEGVTVHAAWGRCLSQVLDRVDNTALNMQSRWDSARAWRERITLAVTCHSDSRRSQTC